VRAGGEIRVGLIHETQIRLVDQGSGSQRLLAVPAQALTMRHNSQLLIDALEQLVPRISALAGGDATKQFGDVGVAICPSQLPSPLASCAKL
jgi:hypothetical protein